MGIGTLIKETFNPAPSSDHRHKPVVGDMVLVTGIIALAIFGLLMLYSASTDFSYQVYRDANYMFNKQILWMVIGTIVAVVLSRLDYHIWQKFALPVMLVTIGLLGAVMINDQVRYGAVRTLFGGSVQPSELAKVATIIYLSVWLYSKRENLHDMQLGLVPMAVILGIIGGLIYLQPDLSATVTIFILGGLLFFLADGELRQIVLMILVALFAGYIVVQFSYTGRTRLAEYLAGMKDPLNSAYQVKRSFEAIIKGGFFGVGIGNGSAKVTNLPVPPTDSIFAVVAEELGLFGVIILVGLYGILLWRGLKIARRAPDSLGMVMAAGLTFWIVIEAFINMGVMVQLFPFAGNALPFVSAGGSNLISSLAAIGILVSISRQAGQGAPKPELEERRNYGASVDLRRRDRRRGFTRTRRPASHER